MFRTVGFLILALLSTTASANIIGKDDRTIQHTVLGDPLAAIGTLFNLKSEGRGTAFLVSRCHILTNFHVGLGRDSKNFDRQQKSLFQLLSGESSEAIPVIFGNYDFKERKQEDWVLLRLTKCLGEKYRAKGMKKIILKPTHAWDLMMKQISLSLAGFPGDKDGKALIVDPACRVRDTEWRHDCATRRGNSGSPIYSVDSNGDLFVVAINAETVGNFEETVRYYGKEIANRAVAVNSFIERIQPYLQADELQTR